jgi:uncharacterized membrane protein YfcA
MPPWYVFVIIGVLGGISAGFFGIGGGIVIVPALIYWAGFSQHMATGTSIAVLLPPIGLAAAFEYYRHGNVDVRAALILAVTMFLGTWVGAYFANQMAGRSSVSSLASLFAVLARTLCMVLASASAGSERVIRLFSQN